MSTSGAESIEKGEEAGSLFFAVSQARPFRNGNYSLTGSTAARIQGTCLHVLRDAENPQAQRWREPLSMPLVICCVARFTSESPSNLPLAPLWHHDNAENCPRGLL